MDFFLHGSQLTKLPSGNSINLLVPPGSLLQTSVSLKVLQIPSSEASFGLLVDSFAVILDRSIHHNDCPHQWLYFWSGTELDPNPFIVDFLESCHPAKCLYVVHPMAASSSSRQEEEEEGAISGCCQHEKMSQRTISGARTIKYHSLLRKLAIIDGPLPLSLLTLYVRTGTEDDETQQQYPRLSREANANSDSVRTTTPWASATPIATSKSAKAAKQLVQDRGY